MAATKRPKRFPRIRRVIKWLGVLVLGLFVLSVLTVLLFRFLPPPTSGVMIERRMESWSGKGAPGKTPYTAQYRWVSFDKIAPEMGAAAIAGEDQNFLSHSGFDWKAIDEAMAQNKAGGGVTRGASTLSQQTAKNLFLWSGRRWVRKGLEAYLTVLMETLWPKRRILEMYLNIVELGDGVYGVEAASQKYFHKPAARLTSEEAALLAAVLPNPRRFRADAPSPYVRERQQWILTQMGQIGGVTVVKGMR